MLITCPECNSQISDKAIFCPHCGFPMDTREKSVKKPQKKRRQYPKLPNGFGSIKKLSGNRTNPYGVYPATKEFTLDGVPVPEKAIAYVKDWYTAFGVLSAYNSGKYSPGDEITFDVGQISDDLVRYIISAYNYGGSNRRAENDATFTEVYEAYIKWEFDSVIDKLDDESKKRRLKNRKDSMRAAYKNCSSVHNLIFRNIKYQDLQDAVDNCDKKHASKELIVCLFHKMYKYADIADITHENRSKYVTIKTDDDDESGVPFTYEEFAKIWENRDDEILEMICIMCLSGFRIGAYIDMEVNLEENYFKGGVKTKNGIERIVPIHSAILPLVKSRIEKNGRIFPYRTDTFRKSMYSSLERIGIPKHTPHDCRDTFATYCDAAKVDKAYLKRLMGHSLANDITEDKYIHPPIDALRSEIEKIDLSQIVANKVK